MSFRFMPNSDKQKCIQSLTQEQRIVELARITITIVDQYLLDYRLYALISNLTTKEINDAIMVYAPLLRQFLQDSETTEISDAKKLNEVVTWCELIMHTKKASNKYIPPLQIEEESKLSLADDERFKKMKIQENKSEEKLSTNAVIDDSILLTCSIPMKNQSANDNKKLHLNPKPHQIKKSHLPSYSQHHQFFSNHAKEKYDVTSRREIKQPSSFRR